MAQYTQWEENEKEREKKMKSKNNHKSCVLYKELARE